jgi:hypothetical protein
LIGFNGEIFGSFFFLVFFKKTAIQLITITGDRLAAETPQKKVRPAHTVTGKPLLASPFDRFPNEQIVRAQVLKIGNRIVCRVFEKPAGTKAKVASGNDFSFVSGNENSVILAERQKSAHHLEPDLRASPFSNPSGAIEKNF